MLQYFIVPLFQDRTFVDETIILNVKSFDGLMTILENITAIHTVVKLTNISTNISNCMFINSTLGIMGNMTRNNVYITESVFKDSSTIVIQSVTSVALESSLLEPTLYQHPSQPTHMLQIKHAMSTKISNVTLASNMKHNNSNQIQTDGGLWVENVTNVKISDSTFRNIGMAQNGSVLMIIMSSIELDSCEFDSNHALNGIIYAEESVEILSKNCTYRNNHVTRQGGVYHITTGNKLVNINR